MKKSKGESQRIYWQQWLSPKHQNSRRELITSSAAIRISPESARAKDVTKLLRNTLNLSSFRDGDGADQDSLVLVGTLYSLPPDYIQFEHESPHHLSSHRGDPFHVVKTLAPNDNPLAIRDKMLDHLKHIQSQATLPSARGPTISPKVQWYFVPSPSSDSPIPNCIELDGYCSSMDNDGLDSDDEGVSSSSKSDRDHHSHRMDKTDESASSTGDASSSSPLFDNLDLMLSRCPFLNGRDDESGGTKSVGSNENICLAGWRTPTPNTHKDHELQRYHQLNQCLPTSVCISGYLLKRSNIDPHVWRRVHCVLTGDNLWYVSRVPYRSSSKSVGTTTTSCSTLYDNTLRTAKKHGRVALDRALLLEPNSDYKASPLYRIPNSFEVVSSRGTSHIFRAPNHTIQRQWLRALSTKILDSFENSLMAHAELIVQDECIARNKRFASLAVNPIWDAEDQKSPIVLSVLRLGMDISEYREQRRHVQAFLPAKQPIVVITSEVTPRKQQEKQKPPLTSHPSAAAIAEPMDKDTKRLVQAAWDTATIILSRATRVSLQFHNNNDNNDTGNNNGTGNNNLHTPSNNKHMSRSLETLCRHVDYVITGTHRSFSSHGNYELNNGGGGTSSGKAARSSSSSSIGSSSDSKHDDHDPPPMDLFDNLLAELQSLVIATLEPEKMSKSTKLRS